MARTQKLWTPPPARDSGRASASMLFAALLTAMLMAYVLLVFHPRLVQEVRAAWSSWGGQPAWALSTVAVGALVSSASLALMTLAAVARGVQSAPYAWSAPVLIGACALEAAQLDTSLPIADVSVPAFAACSGLLMLIGGGLLQIRGWTYKVSGLLLLCLPLMTIALGYLLARGAAHDSWQGIDSTGRTFAVVMLLMWIGSGLLSLTTRPARSSTASGPQQLERWKERAQRGEIRLAQAQRRAEIAEHRLLKQSNASRVVAVAPPPRTPQPAGGSVYWTLSAGVLAAALFAGYGLAYRPLRERVQRQHEEMLTNSRAHALALQAAVEQFEAQRRELNAQLGALRSKQAPAAAIAAPAATQVVPRAAAAAHARTRPPASAHTRHSSASERSSASDHSPAIDDDPIGGLDEP